MNVRATTSLCHLCCVRVADSRDHFLPKSAGNAGEIDVHYMSHVENGTGVFTTTRYQNGFWTRTLCGTCNSKTARFGTAYRKLVQQVRSAATLRDRQGRRLVSVRDVYLSRAIGQMYAMLLSTMPVLPATKWQPLQEWLLSRHAPLPPDLPRVLLYLNRSNFGRIVPVCGIVELVTGGGALVAEVSLPPLGIVFQFGEYDRTAQMEDVSAWMNEPYDRLGRVPLALPEYVLHANAPLAFGPPDAYQRLEAERGLAYLFKSDGFDVVDLGAFIAKRGDLPV